MARWPTQRCFQPCRRTSRWRAQSSSQTPTHEPDALRRGPRHQDAGGCLPRTRLGSTLMHQHGAWDAGRRRPCGHHPSAAAQAQAAASVAAGGPTSSRFAAAAAYVRPPSAGGTAARPSAVPPPPGRGPRLRGAWVSERRGEARHTRRRWPWAPRGSAAGPRVPAVAQTLPSRAAPRDHSLNGARPHASQGAGRPEHCAERCSRRDAVRAQSGVQGTAGRRVRSASWHGGSAAEQRT